MAFKIKDGVRIGTVDVFNNAGTLLVNAPTATSATTATTANKVANALTVGTGLTLSSGTTYDGSAALTISHTDTSSAANLTASGRTYVTGLTFDTFGHVTGYTTGTETVTDTNTTYDISAASTTGGANLVLTAGGSGSGTDSVKFAEGSNITITQTDANTITIAAASLTESDTLQTVTGRGASSNVATISLTGGTASTNTTSGTLVVTGGVGISGALNVGGSVVITGNLTVDGTTTTVNSTTITVDDKNLELGSVASPDNTTADGGGITLKGATDKTLNWINATSAWTSSEHFNLLTGKAYYINGTSVLNSTTLGSGVTSSSLTKVGLSSSGFVKSDASGNLSVDTGTYLTSESDTLATVTARGNTTNAGIIQQASSTNVFSRTAITATVATTSANQVVDDWAKGTFRSVKYVVQVVQGSNYQVSEILVIHDDTTTYMTEFAVLETNGALATFTSAVNGANVELRVTMGSATSASFKIEKVAMYI